MADTKRLNALQACVLTLDALSEHLELLDEVQSNGSPPTIMSRSNNAATARRRDRNF